MQGGVWSDYCLQEVAEKLDKLGRLLDVFGYARRTGYVQEPVNNFGAEVALDEVAEDEGEVPEPAVFARQRAEARAASVPAPPVGAAPLLK